MTQRDRARPVPADPSGGDVVSAIERWAKLSPDAPALLRPGVPALTYADTAAAVRSLAADLAALGIGRGDRVAVAAEGDVCGAVLLLALLGTAVCCPVSPAWTSAELSAYLDVVRPRAIVVPEHAGAAVEELCRSDRLAVLRARRTGRPGSPALVPERPAPHRRGPAAADPGRTSLILRTSGTTAAGKVVPLTMHNVVAAATATVRAYHLTAADRRLNMMPLFHVQGIVGSLVPSLLCGSGVVCLGELEPAAALAELATGGVTWFSATPAMHRILLAAARTGDRAWPGLRFVRCGSGALDARLREELERAYGVPVIESYGMSEAHQIASTPLAPSPDAVGMVPTVTTIGFLGDDGEVATGAGARGEIVIKGPNVVDRYLWPPEADTCFVDGWLRTGDLGSLAADGSLVISGRVKELINHGGEKFSPQEVESVLLDHPGVHEAVVFPVPDPTLGERAAAAIVPAPGADVGERRLRAYLAGRLARHKLPARIVVVPAIPATATGKIARRALAGALADRLGQAADGRAVPPRRKGRPVETALCRLWARALERPQIEVDSEFVALGGGEPAARALAQGVREVFGVEVDAARLFRDLGTVRAMASFVTAERELRATPPDRGRRTS